MSINNVTLVGRLTKDPDLRYTPNGVAVATFTVAVNRPYKDQNGNNQADFINCVIWRDAAENVANYTKKGSLVGVTGMIQTRNYDNQQGQKVYVTEVLASRVQFLEPKNKGQGGGQKQSSPYQNQGQQSNQSNDPFANDGQPIDISDDDLPF